MDMREGTIMRETDVMDYIQPVMSAYNILYTRLNTGAIKIQNRWIRFGKVGWADYIGCMPDGRFLAIETKSTRGRLSNNQKAFRESVILRNGVYILARTLDDILQGINGETKRSSLSE
jgi:hypothetical protein